MRVNVPKTFQLSAAFVWGTPALLFIILPLVFLSLLPTLIAVFYPEASFSLREISGIIEYPELLGAFAANLLILLIQIFYGAFAAGAIAGMVTHGIERGNTNLRAGVATGIRKSLPILASSILFFIIVGVGFFALILPGFMLISLLQYYLPVIVAEDCNPSSSLVRSLALAKKTLPYSFLLALCLTFLFALTMACAYAAMMLFPDDFWVIPAVAALASLILFPILVTVIVVGYFNVKER